MERAVDKKIQHKFVETHIVARRLTLRFACADDHFATVPAEFRRENIRDVGLVAQALVECSRAALADKHERNIVVRKDFFHDAGETRNRSRYGGAGEIAYRNARHS